jgi:hypothetical protein
MDKLLAAIQNLVRRNEIRMSDHGYDELAEENIFVREIIAGVKEALVVEEYVDYPKGPCVLVLQYDQDGNPLHIVWGIPKGYRTPAVVVTAHRPNPMIWSHDFMRRIR